MTNGIQHNTEISSKENTLLVLLDMIKYLENLRKLVIPGIKRN